jgi:hypothetical protein
MKTLHTYQVLLIFTLISVALQSSAQEICNNGIDDDNDGFIDCVDGDCDSYPGCEKILSCGNSLYQVISGVLKVFDPVNSSYNDIGSSVFQSYNGAGYNVEDGYIYAIKNISGTSHMLKIDASGEGEDLGSIANWSGITYCADVDQYGNWIAFVAGASPQLRTIDLDQFPLQMTFQNLTNLSGISIPNTADISYNPVQEKYYGMSKNFDLIEIDPVALTIDIVWNEALSTNNFGAAWSDSEGNSYFSNNATGEISRVKFDNAGNPIERVVVAYGEITNNNDGMNCSLSLPPFETDCSDGIDNDGDGYVDGADPDCVQPPPLVELTNDPTVNLVINSWGISAVDYNGDGYDDIFVPAYDPNVKSKLYLNDGTGSFSEHQGDALVNDLLPTIAPTWGDLNNDGQIDVAIANNTGEPIRLYLNNNQTFENLNAQIDGLTDGYSHNICFVDYNRDGWLDLFASDFFTTNFNQLYRNKGDGTMERIYGLELVNEANKSIGAIWADVNNDGWPDCFVPNFGSTNVLYINQEGKSFTPIEMGDADNSVGASFGDFDNDLDLDLFVANASNQHNILYTNDGSGNFARITSGWVAEDKGNSHGSVWADLDNDGWQDLVVMNDQDGSKFLYMNNGDGTFGKVTNSPFISPAGNSFAIVSTDLELDGDLDLIISNHSNEKNRVFVNNLATGHYLLIRLEGTNSNRSAIGARIFVNAIIDGVNTTLMREVMGQTGGGPGSQSTLNQHFGLADATNVISIEVHWPSGYVQTLTNVSSDQFIDIKEDDGALVSGYVFQDDNENCIQDAAELPLPGTMININSGALYAITDENGYYEISLPIGSYTIQQEIPDNYETTCQPNPHNITVASIGQVISGIDFPDLAIVYQPDLSVDVGTTALRRGFDNEMVISVANLGTENATGVILDLSLAADLSLSSTSFEWDNTNGNTYQWNIDTLLIGETIIIHLKNYVDLNAELGAQKIINASISTPLQEIKYDNNAQELTEIIVGSLDPNDMLASPGGIGSSHLIDQNTRLQYKVRFQNVGNYPASFVTILDTLSEHLDLSTLRLGAASHDYEFKILDNNILKWYFKDIDLVDSLHDEPNSHGFIKFTIKPKPGLSDGTRIINKAAIQFDYNPYLLTNTIISTLNSVENLPDEFTLHVFPNPGVNEVECYLVNKDIYKAGEQQDRGTLRLDIYHHTGTHMKSYSFNSHDEINYLDISSFTSGLYYIRYQDDLGLVKIAKLIKTQ